MSPGDVSDCMAAVRKIEELTLFLDDLEADERKARLYDLLREAGYLRDHFDDEVKANALASALATKARPQ